MVDRTSASGVRVELRPSTLADFVALQGEGPRHRARCITALVDGRVIGIGGLVQLPGGGHAAAVLMADEARRYPVAIHRAGLEAIAMFKRLKLTRVVAQADPHNPAAERWLIRLGFVAEPHDGKRVFVWQPDR